MITYEAALTLPLLPKFKHRIKFAHQQSPHLNRNLAWKRQVNFGPPFQRQTLLFRPLSRWVHPTLTPHPPKHTNDCSIRVLTRFDLRFRGRLVIVPNRTLASCLDPSACCQSARLKIQAGSEVFVRAFCLFYVWFIIAWSHFVLIETFSSQKFLPSCSHRYELLIHLRHLD